jgi:hypothetical protein
MAYNPFHKLRENIVAIRIALAFRESDKLHEVDAAALRKYTGFGGLKAVLYPAGEIAEWKSAVHLKMTSSSIPR